MSTGTADVAIRSRLAVGVALLATALTISAVFLAFLGRDVVDPELGPASGRILAPLGILPTLAVGVILVRRLPTNSWYGIVWVAAGASLALLLFGQAYVAYAVHAKPGALPAADVVASLTSSGWATWLGALALMLLLFPTGRPPSARWRWLVALVIGAVAVEVVAGLLMPGELGTAPVDNPFGVAGPVGEFASGVLLAAGMLIFLAVLVGFASLVMRYRRGDAVERLQVKWLALAGGLFAGYFLLGFVWEPAPLVDAAVEALLMALLPVAVAIAVLRYRLYEIDRIISRTATYAMVTAVLVGVYALVAVVPAVTFELESDLLVAAATLAAAALFVPVRRRVQGWVDRRFNRARYDARLVADRFAVRLRDEVDLRQLTTDLRAVVGSTVQPATVSLWLTEGST